MFDWFRKKKKAEPEIALEAAPVETEESQTDEPVVEEANESDVETAAEVPQPEEPVPSQDEAEAELEMKESEEAQAPEPPTEIEESAAPKKGFFSRLFGDKPSEKEVAAETESQPETVETEPESMAVEPNQANDEPEETVIEQEPVIIESEPVNVEPEPVIESPLPATEPAAEASPPALSTAGFEIIAEFDEDEEDEDDLDEIGADDLVLDEFDENGQPRRGLIRRFKESLSATRNQLAGRIETLLSSVRAIDDDLLDELEELLITSDLGTKTTTDLLYKIRGQVASKELTDGQALKEALKKRIQEMVELPWPPRPEVKPLVFMVVGINGVGKTTTIAKLTRRIQSQGEKVLLAAGDTFRSAAVDQLTIWAERLGADIVSQPTGADASAVVFDALTAAQARGSDVVIIDTAGRLHTKVNLMDELKKIKRVAGKALPGAPHHTILVLDGNTGQNALRQAQTFHEAVGVDSIIVTKLDGTAKGGVIVSISNELKIPITYIGLGESFEDLKPFNAKAFTEAILTP